MNVPNKNPNPRSIGRWALGCLCLLGIVASAPKRPLTAAGPRTLDEHRWLLLFSPNAENQYLQEQNRLLGQVQHGLADRNLVVVQVLGNAVVANPTTTEKLPAAAELRKRYRVNPAHFTIILVGKDGEEKYRAPHAQAPAVLFKIIDDMPMRRQEMQQKQKG